MRSETGTICMWNKNSFFSIGYFLMIVCFLEVLMNCAGLHINAYLHFILGFRLFFLTGQSSDTIEHWLLWQYLKSEMNSAIKMTRASCSFSFPLTIMSHIKNSVDAYFQQCDKVLVNLFTSVERRKMTKIAANVFFSLPNQLSWMISRTHLMPLWRTTNYLLP